MAKEVWRNERKLEKKEEDELSLKEEKYRRLDVMTTENRYKYGLKGKKNTGNKI